MKELKVGERITITLEAIESDKCEGCYFYDKNGCNVRGKFECIDKYRSDHKNVTFKEVTRMNENLKCMLQAFGFCCFAAFFVMLDSKTIVIHPESIVGICLSFTFLIISVILFIISYKL